MSLAGPIRRYGDIARILELARSAAGWHQDWRTDKSEVTGPHGGAIQIEPAAALKKVYGHAGPGSSVVDIEALPMLMARK
jgi:hypothetical protein